MNAEPMLKKAVDYAEKRLPGDWGFISQELFPGSITVIGQLNIAGEVIVHEKVVSKSHLGQCHDTAGAVMDAVEEITSSIIGQIQNLPAQPKLQMAPATMPAVFAHDMPADTAVCHKSNSKPNSPKPSVPPAEAGRRPKRVILD